VSRERRSLWILWALMLLALGLYAVLATWLPHRAIPWNAGEAAVAGFVLAIFALACGVGTFALRESLALREVRRGALDPATPAGFARLRRMLFALWLLCHGIAALGCVLVWGSGDPTSVALYVGGAAVLCAIHAPRDWLFTVPARASIPA
jgi:hypothetical protein